MARTKEQIAEILTKRYTRNMMQSSAWGDLVAAVQAATPGDRDVLLNHVKNGRTKQAGIKMQRLLVENAKSRAKTQVDTMLADDSLNLTELDELI